MVDTPYQYITTTGVIVPDTSALQTEVETEYKAVFNQDLIVTADTPQGLLITAQTLARDQEVNNNAALANQINPNLAGGVFLDAITALTNPDGRSKQTQTVVLNVLLTGVPNSIVPEASIASTSAGDMFKSTGSVTLDASGNGTINFVSLLYGPIPCPADALNVINAGGALGWETVNNPVAGTLGTTTQSDQVSRAYRNNTLAFNGISLIEAITSALYATAGVQSLKARENVSGMTATIDGIVMISHSYYFCVFGGTDTDIAAALLENKSSGGGWNGGTTINLVEPASGQTYAVKFDRPTQVQILVRVTTPNGNAQQITQAVVDYAAGLINNVQGFVVGVGASPWEIAGAIMAEQPGTFISKVELAINVISPVYSTDDIEIAINEIPYTQASFVSVVIAP